MRSHISLLCLAVSLSIPLLIRADAAADDGPLARVRIALVGDSTVTSKAGWGDGFSARLSDRAEVTNLAAGGRSSMSFVKEGRWKRCLELKPDYVLIQFGHNDQKVNDPKLGTDPETTFRAYMTRYVDEARAAGIKPVLVTSLSRRAWGEDGKIHSTLGPYVGVARALAKEKNVPLIDLHARSIELYERLGRAEVDTMSPRRPVASSDDPAQKGKAEVDATHLNARGSAAVGKVVAEELAKAVPALAPYVKAASAQAGIPAAVPPPVAPARATVDVGPAVQATEFKFAFGPGEAPGYTHVAPQMALDAKRGFGFLNGAAMEPGKPAVFAVAVEEGNYDVTIRFGDPAVATATTIKAESRRLMIERVETAANNFETRTFAVNVRKPAINTGDTTKLNDREKGPPPVPDWDDYLTLEFNGKRPGVASIEIRPTRDAITVFLAGDSTVTDQPYEPYAGWGQMLPRFFGRGVAVSNQAESGLTLVSFERQRRLEKILSMMKKGDYLFVQFGHNDQKDKRPGAGPFTTYKADLKRFVAAARGKGGIPVLVTPMERRRFDQDGKPTTTLADYAAAVRQVGAEEKAPVIDLHAMSLKFYAALGPEKSAQAFAHYPANTFPGQDKPLEDNTHHNAYGGYELARCVVEGIRANVPAVAAHLAEDAGTFDPANPDSPEKVDIPASPVTGATKKPTGN